MGLEWGDHDQPPPPSLGKIPKFPVFNQGPHDILTIFWFDNPLNPKGDMAESWNVQVFLQHLRRIFSIWYPSNIQNHIHVVFQVTFEQCIIIT